MTAKIIVNLVCGVEGHFPIVKSGFALYCFNHRNLVIAYSRPISEIPPLKTFVDPFSGLADFFFRFNADGSPLFHVKPLK